MTALMEAQLVSQEYTLPPAIRFMQDDSFSKEQVTAHEDEHSSDLFGAFISPHQQTSTLSPSARERNSAFVQDFVGLWSSDVQPTVRVLEPAARKHYIPEIISTSETIRTVAVAVFDNVRPLKDKELNYLRNFYGRVYKKR